MSCATCRAISAHAARRFVRSSSAALALQVVGHLVEVVDQAPQLVGRGRDDARVEIAARDAPRRARQAVHRIGDALGHVIADAGAEQDEEHRREQHAAIELVDLRLDLLLAQASGTVRIAPDSPSRPAGGDDVFEPAEAFSPT